MRYKIYSFRGFDFADSFEKAWEIMDKMLDEIREDGFGTELCWIVILDTHKNLKKIISSIEAGQHDSTIWIRI